MVTVVAMLLGFAMLAGEVIKAWEPPTVEKLVVADAPTDLKAVRVSLHVVFYALKCSDIHVVHRPMGDHRDEDLTSHMRLTPVDSGRGCDVQGVLDASGAGGTVFVALQAHALQGSNDGSVGITIQDFALYNASHRIEELRFFAVPEKPWDKSDDGGASVPGKLDSTLNVHHEKTAHYIYHLHVVPVVAVGKAISSSAPPSARQLRLPFNHRQFHVLSEMFEVITALQRLGMPGLYISFEFSHLVVERTRPDVDLVELLIHSIGVVGGVSVLAALIDTTMHLTLAPLKRKLD